MERRDVLKYFPVLGQVLAANDARSPDPRNWDKHGQRGLGLNITLATGGLAGCIVTRHGPIRTPGEAAKPMKGNPEEAVFPINWKEYSRSNEAIERVKRQMGIFHDERLLSLGLDNAIVTGNVVVTVGHLNPNASDFVILDATDGSLDVRVQSTVYNRSRDDFPNLSWDLVSDLTVARSDKFFDWIPIGKAPSTGEKVLIAGYKDKISEPSTHAYWVTGPATVSWNNLYHLQLDLANPESDELKEWIYGGSGPQGFGGAAVLYNGWWVGILTHSSEDRSYVIATRFDYLANPELEHHDLEAWKALTGGYEIVCPNGQIINGSEVLEQLDRCFLQSTSEPRVTIVPKPTPNQ